MAKFEIKYSQGDIVYTMCEDRIVKAEIVNFSIERGLNDKTSFESRIRYKLKDVIPKDTVNDFFLMVIYRPNIDSVKEKDIYLTIENVITSLNKKFKEKYE